MMGAGWAALLWMVATADVTAQDLVQRYDNIMGAENFDGQLEMTTRREDGSTRSYKIRVLKAGRDKLRLWFSDPASVRGQEMLHQGEGMWVYLPNLKRSLRLASRDSFQGADFNNADVLRAAYEIDYTASLADKNDVPQTWLVELSAKTPDAAYDHIKLWLHQPDSQPIKGEYYTANGKLLRAAEFSDVRSFAGHKRPAKVVMKNMLATERYSTLVVNTFDTKVHPAAAPFSVDNLGH